LTNYYKVKTADGMITPLDFLALAGAQVRYYKTTTFMHAKYMNADNETASVSSVNYSYTSFMENREAGMLIEGKSMSPLFNFLDSIFDSDWAAGAAWPTNSYNTSDLQIITNTSPVTVTIPPPRNYTGQYVPPLVKVTHSFSDLGLITSPDFAYENVMDSLKKAKKSISIEIYQIVNGSFCDFFINAYNSGVNVTIYVSDEIFSYSDFLQAKQCYTKMYGQGLIVRKSKYDTFKYTHAKFWILDGSSVFMSTGNLGGTDYPEGSNTYPPYGNSNWRDVNRDQTIHVEDSTVVGIFQKLFDEDWKTGHNFYPSK